MMTSSHKQKLITGKQESRQVLYSKNTMFPVLLAITTSVPEKRQITALLMLKTYAPLKHCEIIYRTLPELPPPPTLLLLLTVVRG